MSFITLADKPPVAPGAQSTDTTARGGFEVVIGPDYTARCAEKQMEQAMTDQPNGITKQVAEIKFLIHDLRVESFINEVIHFHVTINTDLEIYNVDQAQVIHGEDLQELKTRAVNQRKGFQEYCNAVKSFSPEQTILTAGTNLILNNSPNSACRAHPCRKTFMSETKLPLSS